MRLGPSTFGGFHLVSNFLFSFGRPKTMIQNTWGGFFLSFLDPGMSICKVCLDDVGRASMLSTVTTNFWGFTSFWVLTFQIESIDWWHMVPTTHMLPHTCTDGLRCANAQSLTSSISIRFQICGHVVETLWALISVKYSSNKWALEQAAMVFWPSQLSVVEVHCVHCQKPPNAAAPNTVLRRRITHELASNQEHK